MAKVKKKKNGLLIFLIIVIILLVAGIAGYVYFQADEITYVGSSHYSDQEMNSGNCQHMLAVPTIQIRK